MSYKLSKKQLSKALWGLELNVPYYKYICFGKYVYLDGTLILSYKDIIKIVEEGRYRVRLYVLNNGKIKYSGQDVYLRVSYTGNQFCYRHIMFDVNIIINAYISKKPKNTDVVHKFMCSIMGADNVKAYNHLERKIYCGSHVKEIIYHRGYLSTSLHRIKDEYLSSIISGNTLVPVCKTSGIFSLSKYNFYKCQHSEDSVYIGCSYIEKTLIEKVRVKLLNPPTTPTLIS